jgi:hypothetical protein
LTADDAGASVRRALSPAFFMIESVFSPTLVALIVPGRVTCAVLAASILLQTLTTLTAAWTVRGHPLSWRYAPLEIVRVPVMFACWLSACVSRTVSSRGNALGVGRGTALTPIRVDATEDERASARSARAACRRHGHARDAVVDGALRLCGSQETIRVRVHDQGRIAL